MASASAASHWADRFPSIVEAAARLEAHSFLIVGEVVIARDDGMSDFRALRSRRRVQRRCCSLSTCCSTTVPTCGDLPLLERKQRLVKLIGTAKRQVIRFNEHLAGDGPTVFEHVCRMGLEGIVSKHRDSQYRGGRSPRWIKVKNRAHPAFSRVMDQFALFSIEKHDVADQSDAEKILAIQAHSMEI